jgi:epsilon-lactone hydrolase
MKTLNRIAQTAAFQLNPRSRMIVGALALMEWMVKKNLDECASYRRNLELFSKLIPRLKNVSYRQENLGNIPAQWITPKKVQSDKLLYYLHGGGYLVGSMNTHRRLVSKISREAGIRAVGINYRLAPEHVFPAAVEDSVNGYQILLEKGYSPDKIVIAGDSAGGGLAISTLVSLKEKGLPMPAAAVCLSPWTDLEATGKTNINGCEDILDYSKVKLVAQLYTGNKNLRHPLASPIYADLSGLPPLYIQVGSSEVLLDDAVRLHKKALAYGVNSLLEEWKGLFHVWHAYDFILPEASTAIKKIAAFINNVK